MPLRRQVRREGRVVCLDELIKAGPLRAVAPIRRRADSRAGVPASRPWRHARVPATSTRTERTAVVAGRSAGAWVSAARPGSVRSGRGAGGEELGQRPAGVRAPCHARDLRRRAGGDPIEVVLDEHHRVAGVDQPVQHQHQPLDIRHVQADARLIQQIHRVQGLAARIGPGPGELGDQLDALRLAAGERARLAVERQERQADLVETPEPGPNFREQEIGRLIERPGQRQRLEE